MIVDRWAAIMALKNHKIQVEAVYYPCNLNRKSAQKNSKIDRSLIQQQSLNEEARNVETKIK
jgi:hypothetical protein